MATAAVAREAVFALRREIARIEGTPSQRLEAPGRGASGVRPPEAVLPTGVEAFDKALGGGLPRAALTEIHGRETRDAGSVSGFALALVGLLAKPTAATVLWIGAADLFHEAGLPYALEFSEGFGVAPENLLVSEASKPADALWIAEEAARLTALAAVVLELRGDPRELDLTATRRLHRRAAAAGRPVLLLRHAARAGPTAAPVRLIVSTAPATPRATLRGPLEGSIGPPAFTVAIDKNRLAPCASFVLQWNADERSLQHRTFAQSPRAKNPVSVVPLSRHGTDMATQAGARMALEAG